MEINGREVGLFYSIQAHCEYSEYLIKNPEESVAAAIIHKAILMNKAWLAAQKAEGVEDLPKPLTREELGRLPVSVLNQLGEAIQKQEKKDSEVTVETEEPKGKKGKSADE